MSLRQLAWQFGPIDAAARSQIATLPIPLLEDLGEDLLDFTALTNLVDWLQKHQTS